LCAGNTIFVKIDFFVEVFAKKVGEEEIVCD
jgi:hypothetical protein